MSHFPPDQLRPESARAEAHARRRTRAAASFWWVLCACGAASAPAAPAVPTDPPAAAGAFAPELVADGDGVIATWIEPREGGAAIRFSRFRPADEPAWSVPRTVVDRHDLFANWADRPAVRRLPDGSLLAHDLRKIAAGTYAYGVRLSRSIDDGMTWSDLGWLHDDTRAVEHGFVSMLPAPGGLMAFWLDGREMPGQKPGEGHAHGDDHGGAMTLRTAQLAANPAPAQAPPATSLGLDGRVCECCDTDAAIAASGPLVVYRDRGPNEERDIFIVRRVAGEWTAPLPVSRDGWIMPGCPVNGPSIDAQGGQVCVVWFTAAAGEKGNRASPRVLAATSRDSGAAFSPPIQLSDTGIGRTDVVMLPDGDAIACWVDQIDPPDASGPALDRRHDAGSIALRRIASDGTAGSTAFVAAINLGRPAGFPRLHLVAGDAPRLLLVWRDEEANRIRALLLDPPA